MVIVRRHASDDALCLGSVGLFVFKQPRLPTLPESHKEMMRVFVYILLLMASLVCAALVWDRVAVDKLFYCSDSLGPFDFMPPFVHLQYGDYYIAPRGLVWVLWAALVSLAVTLPAAAIWVCSWSWRYCSRHRAGSPSGPAE
jgi:hypothetical protein